MKNTDWLDIFQSFSSDRAVFVSSEGLPGTHVPQPTPNTDSFALWRLGKEAFDGLSDVDTSDDFRRRHDGYLKNTEIMKSMLRAACDVGVLQIKLEGEGGTDPMVFDWLSRGEILSLGMGLVGRDSESFEFLKEDLLFACLEAVQDALDCIALGQSGGAHYAIAAANALADFQAIHSGNQRLQVARQEMGARAAAERYRNDPKQAAKRYVKERFIDWEKNPAKYKSQNAFAMDMLEKVATHPDGKPIISSDTVIKNWIPKWKKGDPSTKS